MVQKYAPLINFKSVCNIQGLKLMHNDRKALYYFTNIFIYIISSVSCFTLKKKKDLK